MGSNSKSRVVLQFNEMDFRHRRALDILRQRPRSMSELVVNAILHYTSCPEAANEFGRDWVVSMSFEIWSQMENSKLYHNPRPQSRRVQRWRLMILRISVVSWVCSGRRSNAMSNKKFGYARVSTAEQNEDRQVLELLEYGIEERDIYVDKQSGRSFERTNYMSLRNSILRNGDILVVKSIDRFGRNYSGIRTEWEYLTKTLGVDIVVLDTPILDTTRYKDLLGSVITDIVLAVLSFGAQLEVDTKSKAQAEGIAAAHLKGVKFGRPKCSVKDWDIYYPKWKQGEITAVECYRQLGVSASTFYRLVHKFESEEKAR